MTQADDPNTQPETLPERAKALKSERAKGIKRAANPLRSSETPKDERNARQITPDGNKLTVLWVNLLVLAAGGVIIGLGYSATLNDNTYSTFSDTNESVAALTAVTIAGGFVSLLVVINIVVALWVIAHRAAERNVLLRQLTDQ